MSPFELFARGGADPSAAELRRRSMAITRGALGPVAVVALDEIVS